MIPRYRKVEDQPVSMLSPGMAFSFKGQNARYQCLSSEYRKDKRSYKVLIKLGNKTYTKYWSHLMRVDLYYPT